MVILKLSIDFGSGFFVQFGCRGWVPFMSETSGRSWVWAASCAHLGEDAVLLKQLAFLRLGLRIGAGYLSGMLRPV